MQAPFACISFLPFGSLETNKGIYVFDDIANRRQSNFRIK